MITASVQDAEKSYPSTNNRAGRSGEAPTSAEGLEVLHFTIGASSLGKGRGKGDSGRIDRDV